MDFENKSIKKLSPLQAKRRAEKTCAYQERCQQEMRDKLYSWGLHSNDVENIIVDLITNNFIDEERFAKAFAGGKFRIKKWGKIKIKLELKKRGISEYCIKQAMKEISNEDYFETIESLIEKKCNEYAGLKVHEKNYKVVQYLARRGFEQNLVWDLLS